jgi:hypothetical protein
MKGSFLEYYKVILKKVSFDRDLFIKEYKKALNTVREDEADQLSRWIQLQGFEINPLTIDSNERFV